MEAAAHRVAASQDAVSLSLGGCHACISANVDIRHAALDLRSRVFRQGAADDDAFDPVCLHGVVRRNCGSVALAFRIRLLPSAVDLGATYTGQFYDLEPLTSLGGPFLELGRFCQPDGPTDIMASRLGWAALGAFVDAHGVEMLFGCTSFQGACPDIHAPALAMLRAAHLGPETLRPGKRAPDAVDLPVGSGAKAALPHLLRSYLNMGGWVSDHAVRDIQLDTLHVFTGLCIADIPEARKQRLRALAQTAPGTRLSPLDVAAAAP